LFVQVKNKQRFVLNRYFFVGGLIKIALVVVDLGFDLLDLK